MWLAAKHFIKELKHIYNVHSLRVLVSYLAISVEFQVFYIDFYNFMSVDFCFVLTDYVIVILA